MARSERTQEIRDAAISKGNGQAITCEHPSEPTVLEAIYLTALEYFIQGRQCRGWDAIDAAEALEARLTKVTFDQ